MDKEMKKGTPEGAPKTQLKNTTPKLNLQDLANVYLDLIGEGKTIKRNKYNESVDRRLRELIAEKNLLGEDVIINNGDGYFKAGPDDGPALKAYLAKERSKATAIWARCDMMKDTWEGLYGNL